MFTGNYDVIQQPKDISEIARQRIPFYMFVDEETEAYMKNSSLLDSDKRSGIWRIIVVRNVPYADPRRNGKVSRTDSSTFILFLCGCGKQLSRWCELVMFLCMLKSFPFLFCSLGYLMQMKSVKVINSRFPS